MSTDTSKPKQIAKRNALIDAALDVFSRDGFAAAKMDDVALSAEVSKGTIYLYFDSKEDLFFEVVRSRITSVLDRLEHMTFDAQGLNTRDLLRHQLEFAYQQLAKWQLQKVMHLIVSEGPRFPRIVRYYYESVVERAIALIRRTLELGVSRGEIPGPISDNTVRVFIAPIVLLGIWKILFNDLDPIDEADYVTSHISILAHAGMVAGDHVTA